MYEEQNEEGVYDFVKILEEGIKIKNSVKTRRGLYDFVRVWKGEAYKSEGRKTRKSLKIKGI